MPTISKKKLEGKPAPKAAPRMKRKNLILDQVKIDRAKAALGAATETETITRALETVSELADFQSELDTGFARLIGKGGFEDPFRTR